MDNKFLCYSSDFEQVEMVNFIMDLNIDIINPLDDSNHLGFEPKSFSGALYSFYVTADDMDEYRSYKELHFKSNRKELLYRLKWLYGYDLTIKDSVYVSLSSKQFDKIEQFVKQQSSDSEFTNSSEYSFLLDILDNMEYRFNNRERILNILNGNISYSSSIIPKINNLGSGINSSDYSITYDPASGTSSVSTIGVVDNNGNIVDTFKKDVDYTSKQIKKTLGVPDKFIQDIKDQRIELDNKMMNEYTYMQEMKQDVDNWIENIKDIFL